MNDFVKNRVRRYFAEEDLNCATTALLIMSEYFDVAIDRQVLHAAVGMHGAGGYRAQCGIVEGTLMSIGILGKVRGIPEKNIVEFCADFANSFELEFTSLSCRDLRPGGFNDDDPPHLCEELTVRGITHNMKMVAEWLEEHSDIQN